MSSRVPAEGVLVEFALASEGNLHRLLPAWRSSV
jgi:hypothetical protein